MPASRAPTALGFTAFIVIAVVLLIGVLVEGGTILLNHGAVTSFVPNPDHIHVTGVPAERSRAVSLHLYGRMMNSFNTYDIAAGTRRRVMLEHNES